MGSPHQKLHPTPHRHQNLMLLTPRRNFPQSLRKRKPQKNHTTHSLHQLYQLRHHTRPQTTTAIALLNLHRTAHQNRRNHRISLPMLCANHLQCHLSQHTIHGLLPQHHPTQSRKIPRSQGNHHTHAPIRQLSHQRHRFQTSTGLFHPHRQPKTLPTLFSKKQAPETKNLDLTRTTRNPKRL